MELYQYLDLLSPGDRLKLKEDADLQKTRREWVFDDLAGESILLLDEATQNGMFVKVSDIDWEEFLKSKSA